MSTKIQKYIRVFLFETTTILFFHNTYNYTINLLLNKTLFYEFLYTISQKKLKIFQKYIDNNLANNCFRHSIIDVKTFVLFVFKNNKKLRLCIDYKELNAITIKNKILFFLIKKILNCLIDVRYFIKLNFKDVYHRIKIKKNNE